MPLCMTGSGALGKWGKERIRQRRERGSDGVRERERDRKLERRESGEDERGASERWEEGRECKQERREMRDEEYEVEAYR